MKALIIEDKEYIRKALINLLELVDFDIQVIGECESVQDALTITKACKPELLFLDINLTDGSAFDFLDKVEAPTFKIIFITAYEEHALKALKAGAVDYLLKPVDIDELKEALKKIAIEPVNQQNEKVQKAKRVWANEDDSLVLSVQDSFQVIYLNELLYCESDKGYTTFYCQNDKKYLVSKTIKEFEERLLSSRFVRPHQSFMVNLRFIDKYDKSGTIHLINGAKIPVSSRKRESFLAAFLNSQKKS